MLIHSVNSTGGHSIDCFNHKIVNELERKAGGGGYSSFLLVTTNFNHICEIIEVELNHRITETGEKKKNNT